MTVVSDADSGIKAPGWHWLTSPGGILKLLGVPPCAVDLLTSVSLWDTVIKDGLDCASSLAGIAQSIAKGFTVVSKVTDAVGNFYDIYNRINDQVKSGHINNAKLLVPALNDTKKILVDVYESFIVFLDAETSELTAIEKCIGDAVDTLTKLCNEAVEKECIPEVIGKALCSVLGTINVEYKLVVSGIEDLKNHAGKIVLKHACDLIDFIFDLTSKPANEQTTSLNSLAFLSTFGSSVQTSGTNQLSPLLPVTASNATSLDFQGLIEQLGTELSVLSPLFEATSTSEENLAQNSNIAFEKDLAGVAGEIYARSGGRAPNSPFLLQYNGTVIRGISDADGGLSVFIPSDVDFSFEILDIKSFRIASYSSTTDLSGVATTISPLVFFSDTGSINNDGLTNTAAAIFNVNPTIADNFVHGMTDRTAIEEGLWKNGSLASINGVVATLSLKGEVKSISTDQSLMTNTPISAIATGSFGVSFVDVPQVGNPTLLLEVDLPGDSTEISFDGMLDYAAVASNTGGLNIVDLSGSVRNIAINASVVQVVDGIVYANNGGEMRSYDMLTGERLQTLALGNAVIVSMAREGQARRASLRRRRRWRSQSGQPATSSRPRRAWSRRPGTARGRRSTPQ